MTVDQNISQMKKPPGLLDHYLEGVAAKHKNIESAMRELGMNVSLFSFVKRMFVYSVVVALIVTVALGALFLKIGLNPIFALVLGFAFWQMFFQKFINYPLDRTKSLGNKVERDILFAARDLVVSMRSGLPLYNAMTVVSVGYGAASREFAKIISLVQLGMPMEQAIEEVSNESKSKTFKRIMLQASVSITSGADIISSLQGVLDEVVQERTIELRRYGQRLNALAMFYMLFGIILPSMGIAVAAILTSFIALFSVTTTTLIMGVVFIIGIQVIFLNIIINSRPAFAM